MRNTNDGLVLSPLGLLKFPFILFVISKRSIEITESEIITEVSIVTS